MTTARRIHGLPLPSLYPQHDSTLPADTGGLAAENERLKAELAREQQLRKAAESHVERLWDKLHETRREYWTEFRSRMAEPLDNEDEAVILPIPVRPGGYDIRWRALSAATRTPAGDAA